MSTYNVDNMSISLKFSFFMCKVVKMKNHEVGNINSFVALCFFSVSGGEDKESQ